MISGEIEVKCPSSPRYRKPADIYLLKVNNRNTREKCEICSKLTINIPEQRQLRRSGMLTLNIFHTFF